MSNLRSIDDAARERHGCGFLSRRDLNELLEGALPARRRTRLDEHLDGGCVECDQLEAAAVQFRRILEEGVLQIEAEQFAATEPAARSRLRREFARLYPDAPRELAFAELEDIRAAGPDTPAGWGDQTEFPEEDDEDDDA